MFDGCLLPSRKRPLEEKQFDLKRFDGKWINHTHKKLNCVCRQTPRPLFGWPCSLNNIADTDPSSHLCTHWWVQLCRLIFVHNSFCPHGKYSPLLRLSHALKWNKKYSRELSRLLSVPRFLVSFFYLLWSVNGSFGFVRVHSASQEALSKSKGTFSQENEWDKMITKTL